VVVHLTYRTRQTATTHTHVLQDRRTGWDVVYVSKVLTSLTHNEATPQVPAESDSQTKFASHEVWIAEGVGVNAGLRLALIDETIEGAGHTTGSVEARSRICTAIEHAA